MPTNSDRPGARGIFETLAVIDGRPRLLQRHLARLFEGCSRLDMPAPPASLLAANIFEQAALPGTGVVRLTMTPSGKDPGTPSCAVSAEPPRRRPLAWSCEGVSIITCRTRLPLQPRLAGLKLLDRNAQERARSEWTADSIAEGLMLDRDGRLVSGTKTNVYAVIDGVICTPALLRCGVAGVMRAALLEEWQARGQSTDIRDVALGELKRASEVFLSNALIGIWPVRALDGRALSAGPVAAAASAWVQRIVKTAPAPLPGTP